ncbi:MAG: S1 RNA-binding domain-containing protein [Oscillospiraceae bacterium]
MNFYPEGTLLETASNRQHTASWASLGEAVHTREILEGRVLLCDAEHNLTVEMPGGLRGIIPRAEGALGIEEGSTRDIAILTRVNKPVSFLVTALTTVAGQVTAFLSRRAAQQRCMKEYIETLPPGQVIPARVTHLEPFGCFVDLGCGIPSMIPIDAISVSRIAHPRDRFFVGQNIFAVVRAFEDGRIFLSHKELLGTWEQNASLFAPGQTVAGAVRSVESYGIFVELTPNLAGLAEPREGTRCGMHASVYIKSLLPARMKVKLIIIDAFQADYPAAALEYFISGGCIKRWCYSPEGADRLVETVFS